MKDFMIYMVGISGSGKTTIAEALEAELKKRGNSQFTLIDGDEIRQDFGGIFGYTFEERMRCNQAVRTVVKYLLRNHISVILAQVGAYKEMRSRVKEAFLENYIEVYVKCSYEECARRDVKGYYAKQKNGQMSTLNGADDVFEVPEQSDIIINTEELSVEEAVGMIVRYLEEKGYAV